MLMLMLVIVVVSHQLGTHKRALAKRQAIKDAWAAARAMQ